MDIPRNNCYSYVTMGRMLVLPQKSRGSAGGLAVRSVYSFWHSVDYTALTVGS